MFGRASGDCDRRSFGRQTLSHCRADASAGTGHQSAAPGEAQTRAAHALLKAGERFPSGMPSKGTDSSS